MKKYGLYEPDTVTLDRYRFYDYLLDTIPYNNTFSNFNMARIDTSHKKGFIMQRNVINDIAMPYNSKPNFVLHDCNKPLENTFKN